MSNETSKKKQTIWSRTFICIMCCSMCMSLSQFIVQPLVSTYAAFLGAGAMLVGLLTGLYYGVALALRPVSGPVLVRTDKKKVLIFAFAVGAIVNFCYGTFNSIPIFVMARVLHGVQFSVVGSIQITIAGDSLPRERMGSGLGIYSIGGAISTAIGPAVGLALRSWGESLNGEIGGFKSMFYGAFIVQSLALIPCFLAQPKVRSKEEIANTGSWYNNIIARECVPSAICNMLFAMAHALINSYMIPYAAEQGFVGISVYFTIYAIVLFVSRPISGRLTDKFGATNLIYPAAILLSVSFILLWRATSITTVYIAAAFSAMGYGGAHPAFQTMCLMSLPGVKRGVASNTNFIGIDLGQFLGPTLGGVIIAQLLHTGHAYSSMYMFGVFPVLIAIGVMTFSRKYINSNLAKVAAMGE